MRNDSLETGAAHRELAADALAAFFPGTQEGTGRPMDRTGDVWYSDMVRLEEVFLSLPAPVLHAIKADAPLLSRAACSLAASAIDTYLKRRYGTGQSVPSSAEIGNALAFADLIGALDATADSYGIESSFTSVLEAFAADRDVAMYLGPEGSGFLDATPEVRDDAAAMILRAYLDDIAGEPMQTPAPPRTRAAIRAHIRDPYLICSVIRERKTLDPDVIVPLLDAASPALAEGHL